MKLCYPALTAAATSLLVACAHAPAEAPRAAGPAQEAADASHAAAPAKSVAGGAQASLHAPAAALEPLPKDTPSTTLAGVTFTAPAGWTLAQGGAQLTLANGDDLHVVIVDPQASSADTAVAAAWESYRPGFKRPIRFAQPMPARDGWDEGRTYVYETSPNERLTLVAFGLRRGEGWTVLLIDASDPAYERRAAQVGLIRQSLRPPGYQRESFAGKTAHPLDPPRIRELTDFVEKSRQLAGIPGIAIALVQGDRVVYEGGFGVRTLGQAGAVDPETLFMIASNTKPLSTLLLARLIDEGRFAWDTPVTRVLPGFKLGDADTTARVLMKHLVCACTGLPRQDLEWLFQFRSATAASELELLGTMQPTTQFGETFQYSNLLASAAGFAGAHTLYPELELGAAYDKAMRTRVFEPLGMRATTFDYAAALRANHAMPHAETVDGTPAAAAMDVNYAIHPLRPAGGAWSNVRDLTRYVRMELASGRLPDGGQYVPADILLARRAPQVAVGADATYGMGLFVDRKYGVPVVHHGGSMIGFKSDMFWLPEQGVGGVILTNADVGQQMLGPFVRRVLEVLFDGRLEAAEDVASAVERRKAIIAQERERLVVPADPVAVARLAAAYTNPALGDLEIEKKGNVTVFNFGEWQSEVATRKNDDGTLTFLTTAPGVAGFEFVVDEREGQRALVVRDMQHEYVFKATR